MGNEATKMETKPEEGSATGLAEGLAPHIRKMDRKQLCASLVWLALKVGWLDDNIAAKRKLTGLVERFFEAPLQTIRDILQVWGTGYTFTFLVLLVIAVGVVAYYGGLTAVFNIAWQLLAGLASYELSKLMLGDWMTETGAKKAAQSFVKAGMVNY